jgi:hypothetical protein
MAPVLYATQIAPPPAWAIGQRMLIDTMNRAAPLFQERYTRPDGSFVWRQEWPGMDGSDDAYESYHNWPLFYALGGSADIYQRSRFLWEAVTRQFTHYGQIWREFDAYYDWMHHGESSLFLYYLGLAAPDDARFRARARRFAGMYIGQDAEAQNWDAEHRMIRSPITGSRGPRFINSWDDWQTHRPILSRYPPPFDDIPGVHSPTADWLDDKVYEQILQRINERQMRGDVPLNLTATSLVTHAYLYTGAPQYRQWVLDYVEAWAERIERNDGLCPDNIGPSGIIGELMGGKWWGGHYGWQWPHGWMSIIEPLTIAAMNAVLLTGDLAYLDIPRSQLDRMIELGKWVNGVLMIPHRHTDQGWIDYRVPLPEYALQIWAISQHPHDEKRVELLARGHDWREVQPGRGKGDGLHIAPWYRFLQGDNPHYPRHIIDAQWAEICHRLELMRRDDDDPETWDIHHWQERNPVHTEALVQLTCGGPQIIYQGGLLHVPLRYFDGLQRRPGLPPAVAALVSQRNAESITVTLVNTDALASQRLLIQAGGFGEHQFSTVSNLTSDALFQQPLDSFIVTVDLAPSSQITLRLGLRHYVRQPTYTLPSW